MTATPHQVLMNTRKLNDLTALRKAAGLSQAEMAKRMGLGARAYFQLEAKPSSIKQRHWMLVEKALQEIADDNMDMTLLPRYERARIIRLARLIAD